MLSRNRINVRLGSAVVLASIAFAMPLDDARAQATYPTRTVRVIVPYAAGGGADTIARIVFGSLSAKLGHQFVIDNRGGGAGTIGAAAVAKAPADGYTVLHDATAFSVNPALLATLPYDARKDFQPVFLVALLPNLLVVHPSVKAKTVADVIAMGKAPGGLDWGSAGNGTVQHLALELFRKMSGAQINHIPYKGGAPALTDLVGGHIKFYFSNTAASTGYVKAGQIRAVAHTGHGRLAAFPDLPPVSDTLKGFEAYEWNGVFVPAQTPIEIVNRLNAALNNAIGDPTVTERFAALSVQTRPNKPAEFAAFVAAEMDKWGKLVKEAGIKIE